MGSLLIPRMGLTSLLIRKANDFYSHNPINWKVPFWQIREGDFILGDYLIVLSGNHEAVVLSQRASFKVQSRTIAVLDEDAHDSANR